MDEIYFSFESIRDFDKRHLFCKIDLAEKGVAKNQLKQLCDVLDLPINVLSDILGVHERTLYIKKDSERCNKNITNEILGIVEVYTRAYNIFSSQSVANSWMKQKLLACGGRTPIELFRTFPGRQEIKDQLIRCEYGILG